MTGMIKGLLYAAAAIIGLSVIPLPLLILMLCVCWLIKNRHNLTREKT